MDKKIEIRFAIQEGPHLAYKTLDQLLDEIDDPIIVIDFMLGSIIVVGQEDLLEDGIEAFVSDRQLEYVVSNYTTHNIVDFQE